MKILMLDTETTGLVNPEAVEIAYFPLADKLELHKNKKSLLMNPTLLSVESFYLERFLPSKPIEPEASKVNGIYLKDLLDKRSSSTFKLPSETEILIGHNISFDHRVLGKPDVKLICTKELSQLVFIGEKGLKNHKLQTLIEFLYPEHYTELLENNHTALQDCKLSYLILLKILEKLVKITEWEHLIQLCSQGIKASNKIEKEITIMSFGKHKGLPIAQIPKDYLNWLRNQDNTSKNLLKAIYKVVSNDK